MQSSSPLPVTPGGMYATLDGSTGLKMEATRSQAQETLRTGSVPKKPMASIAKVKKPEKELLAALNPFLTNVVSETTGIPF